MGLDVRKPVLGGLRTTKVQTSLQSAHMQGQPAVWAYAQSDQRLFIHLLESITSRLASSQIPVLLNLLNELGK